MDKARKPPIAWKLVAALAGFKFLVHLVTIGAWGSEWFVDELYFMACAEHLSWGYVDLPPLLPSVLASATAAFGDSLLVVRLIAALAGAGLVVLVAALAREMGGDRWAQATAALCVILAPIYLVMHGITTMNALDPLFWVGCALVLARILNGGDPRLWLLFGLLAGLGINSKHSFALWGAALVIGLLATDARREFKTRWIWLGGAIAVLIPIIVSGIVIAPISLWCLPPDLYVRYTEALGFDQPRIENHELGPLPQLFADRYGWRAMAEETARVYHALPADERPQAAIFGQNYGQAGAVDRYRKELDLPPAISGHLSYFLWGPGDASGEVMIVLGDDRERLEELFDSVELASHVAHPLAMPYQHIDIFVCRGMKMPVEELWRMAKNYS